MAYLITCSGPKNDPICNSSSIEKLSFSNELQSKREEIIALSEIQLDWNKTLPAWQLYSGRLYSQVEANNWIKPKVEVKILSALFGWIRHTDQIPNYNLRMDMMLQNYNHTVCFFWNSSKVLQNIVNKNDIDLLSNKYRKAINGNRNNCGAIRPDINFKDNYGYHKGVWLNKKLGNI